MAKVDNGKRVKVKFVENGFVSFLGEKAALIMQKRGEIKILGDAEEKKAEPKGK